MSLRARLVASIVTLVAATVVLLSVLYLRTTLQTSFGDVRRIANENAQQAESFLLPRAQAAVERMQPPPATLDEVAEAYVRAIDDDDELDDLLANLIVNSAVIEALITGPDGTVLTASIGSRVGQRFEPLPPLEEFEDRNLAVRLAETFSANQDYDVVRELGIEDRQLFTIHMIVSSLLMRQYYLEPLRPLAIASVIALLVSIFAAVVVSRLAVRPFEKIGDQIDRITRGEQDEGSGPRSQTKELAAVESKLSLLGQQFHGARADTEELRGSIDQLLDRLEEAVLLFGSDDKLAMAGGAAERLVGSGRWELMGKSLAEVLPDHSQLGALVQSAVRMRRQMKDHPVRLEAGGEGPTRNLLVSVELIEDFVRHERMGTLVTLRESDPRKQIELQLDLSTRMAAISRLTSGAAHEIKNPLNSIALHLEVLKQKLAHDATGVAEIEVISREIQRLDRVVKSFLDFTRPVELKVVAFDLAELVRELAGLVRLDAEAQGVEVVCSPTVDQAAVRGDRDLLKQALLNVVVNALQASSPGGRIELDLEATDDGWLVRIKDQGAGIPEAVGPEIYQLYFTTKGVKGSGIGLAMTFQVVQLHGGTIDFVSEVGQGTEFRIQMPTGKGPEATSPESRKALPSQELS